jgi:putative intracellular protease/amidase
MTARVLFVLTSHNTLGSTGRSTGYYVPELAHPLAIIRAAGFEAEFVSPAGGEPPRDGGNRNDPVVAHFLDDVATQAAINASHRPADVDPSRYDAIYYVGGHGTMWDLPDNRELAQIAASIYDRGGVVAAVCHGPAGLVNVRLADGEFLVNGKTVSAFTNEEELAVGLTDVVPFLLENQLRARGALAAKAPNFQVMVTADGRLITGQNPASAAGVAEAMVAACAIAAR